MVTLDSGWSGLGSSPSRGSCVVHVFLGKTLYSYSASLHPGVITGYWQIYLTTGGKPAMD